jgi:excisionase family DNA binding protein
VNVDLEQLASLPALVQQLQAEVDELRRRLTVAERRPYTVDEAARALGVDPKTIRRRCERGEMQHQRVGRRVVVYLQPA